MMRLEDFHLRVLHFTMSMKYWQMLVIPAEFLRTASLNLAKFLGNSNELKPENSQTW